MRLFVSLVLLCAQIGWGAGLEDHKNRQLFLRHQYISLMQRLNEQGRRSDLEWVKEQSQLFMGCQAIKRDQGGFSAVIKCMQYFNNNNDKHIMQIQQAHFTDDVDNLCSKYLDSINVRKILETKAFSAKSLMWPKCTASMWRQVYLTAYANLDANPTHSRSLLSVARAKLAFNPHWIARIEQLLIKNNLSELVRDL